jgi:hypothetical protein
MQRLIHSSRFAALPVSSNDGSGRPSYVPFR